MPKDATENLIFEYTSDSEEATRALGCAWAEVARPGLVIALDGDLGCGKSVFSRGFIRGLGVTDPYLPSPTFTLLNPYEAGRIPVYHFDLYRLEEAEELALIGAEEFFYGDGVSLVEWSE